ncbi:MAG: Xaa-Pro peptidase family protein [Synergistaceae bacterium]|jgi:Xaa-Pro aminopeptidase|nr:Xaa-Pro peptidase family protein [Synergistaceae bacterium]
MNKSLFSLRLKAVESFLGCAGKLAKYGKGASDALILVCQEGFGWEDIYYLTNFIGSSSVLVVTPGEATLFVDPRYQSQAKEDCVCTVVSCTEVKRSSPLNAAANHILARGLGRIAFSYKSMPFQAFRIIEHTLGESAQFTDITYLISNLRRRKGSMEVACIKEAIRIASHAFKSVISETSAGISEREFAGKLEYQLKASGGGFWNPIPVMVSSGRRTSLPHSIPTDREFAEGDIVMVDFGARAAGYVCDLTRMISIGEPTEDIRSFYSVIQWAQAEAAALISPGAATSDIDAAARTILVSAGLGAAFVHGIGHGIGLSIHEVPSLGETSSSVLAEGDIITLEPAFYKDGWGGMRLEDDYLVTGMGSECLSGSFSGELYIV